MKYTIDQDALVNYLEGTIRETIKSEGVCRDNGSYELAMSYREQRYALGNILLMIRGDKYSPPCTVDRGGFMKEEA